MKQKGNLVKLFFPADSHREQDQYKFIYDTLEEYVVCGTSWFPVAELSLRLKQKSVKNPITKINEYQREYQQICKQTPRFTIGDCAGGHRADNREKNRDVLVVPREFQFLSATDNSSTNSCFPSRRRIKSISVTADNFRPYLTSFQGNSFTDYINAVFVDVSQRNGSPIKRICLSKFSRTVSDSPSSLN